jgi:hypothetical protein
LEAWYSPSAVMIRARRSRSASACRDIDRFMPWTERIAVLYRAHHALAAT